MLKEKCTKALDVIKFVANSKWGADKITFLHLYRSLVRSKLLTAVLYMDRLEIRI